METHNHDEHHVYDGVETQERSEIKDHNNSNKVMASSACRLSKFKVQICTLPGIVRVNLQIIQSYKLQINSNL